MSAVLLSAAHAAGLPEHAGEPPKQAAGLPPAESTMATFRRINPCPVARSPSGGCPGHVPGYIRPLCAGGADHVDNVYCITDEEAQHKAQLEKAHCRPAKKRGRR